MAMNYRKLGITKIQVSEVCLGTMTWGRQNTEKDGHEQIDYALAQGINFIDTAEMYSVPSSKETYGATEKIIGTWLNKSGKRDQIILASKIAGPNPNMAHIREGLGFSEKQIRAGIEGSLKRLQTDYLDLYQLHWPERKTNFFGKLDYTHDPNDTWEDNIAEVLQVLNALKQEGKIRHYGLSNETPWGAMRFVAEAKRLGFEAPVSIQNPYSLLNRSYEVGLAEVSIREKMGLLPYSPLAFGVLSGKYLDGNKPENSRLALFPQFSRYSNSVALEATKKYKELADSVGVSLTKLALAFSIQQDFVTSSIIGATTMEQLKENIEAHTFQISADLREELNKIHKVYSNPAP